MVYRTKRPRGWQHYPLVKVLQADKDWPSGTHRRTSGRRVTVRLRLACNHVTWRDVRTEFREFRIYGSPCSDIAPKRVRCYECSPAPGWESLRRLGSA